MTTLTRSCSPSCGCDECRAVRGDPRTELDGQVARAFRIVVNADDQDAAAPPRGYTPEELDELLFALSTALVQVTKIPGGRDAEARFYELDVPRMTEQTARIRRLIDRVTNPRKL